MKMKIISCIKNAGAKIFGIEKTTVKKNAEKTSQLRTIITNLGLEVNDLGIEVDDDAVTLWGEAADLATKEKVVLVVGNTNDVASVEDKMTLAAVKVVKEIVQF